MIQLHDFKSRHPMMKPEPDGWARDLVLFMRGEHARIRLGRAYLSIFLALTLVIILPALLHVGGFR